MALQHPNLPDILDFLGRRIEKPIEMGVVLGSGLGAFTNKIEELHSFDYKEIPGFIRTSIPGHKGRLIYGNLAGKKTLLFAGRIHYYEGYRFSEVTLGVQIVHGLGAKSLALSCSVGGIHPDHKPGDLLLIEDHINLQGTNPILQMIADSKENHFQDALTPFVDMCGAYRSDFFSQLNKCAKKIDATLHKGVLCAVTGPIYETPTEVRFLRSIGADAVCMSTVPETIMARYLGLEVGGIALITNAAHSQVDKGPTHEEVLVVSNRAAPAFAIMLEKMIELM